MTGRLWPFRTGMVKPARQPASGGRSENSTANPKGLATLIVCLLIVNTPEDVTRNCQLVLVAHQVLRNSAPALADPQWRRLGCGLRMRTIERPRPEPPGQPARPGTGRVGDSR